jgi:hypothetical protein
MSSLITNIYFLGKIDIESPTQLCYVQLKDFHSVFDFVHFQIFVAEIFTQISLDWIGD